ncbi:MAG: hypothetical protein WBD51_10890 [Burkholderiaceae bacterium]
MNKIFIAAALAVSSGLVSADDFTDTLENARQAYEEGDIGAAREELVYATQLLGQMRTKKLIGFLPEAIDGWERKDAKDQGGAGLSVMGGGTTATANYKNDKEQIKISIIADSPMIQGLSMLFSNAALAGSQGTMKRIARQKVMVKPDGSLTTLVDKRIMVEVSGRAPAEIKEAYFKLIDFKALAAY